MDSEDLDKIQRNNPDAKNLKKTFAYKFLMVGVRIASWWTIIAAAALVAQVVLLALQTELKLSVVEIPGIGGLFVASGAVAGAVLGLDKLKEVQKMKGGK